MLRRLTARLVAGALATLVLLGVPPASLAAGASSVPPEPGAVVLPGPATLHAAAGDLDNDGTRELVRLVGGPQTNGQVQVEAWIQGRGGWEMAGSPLVLRRGTSVEEAFADRATARTGSAPVLVGEPARIISWNDGSRDRLLIAALGDQPFGIPCCLTLWEPVIGGGRLALAARNDPNGPGETLHAVDLDGDGVDELVMTQAHPPEQTPGFVAPIEVDVLGWDGMQFSSIDRHTFDHGGGSPVWLLGDTDGKPGDELGFVQSGPGPSTMYRLRLEAGSIVLDEAGAPPIVSVVGVPGQPEGQVVYAAGSSSTLAAWPAGGALEERATTGGSGLFLPPIQASGGWRLPLVEPRPLWLILLDEELHTTEAVAPAAAARLATELGVGDAWIGSLPGGDRNGGTATFFAGRLLTADGVRDVASLVGAQPAGLLGDGSWVAVLHRLGTPYELEAEGGRLRQPAGAADAWVSIVPSDALLQPERDGGVLAPSLDGGVPIDEATVATTPDGFAAEISAPPGSRVVPIALDPPLPGQATTGIVPDGGVYRLSIRPPTSDSADLRFAARALVLTPAGHAYTVRWNVRVLASPPALRAEAEPAPLSFDVTLTGRTAPGTAVTLDGTPVLVAPDGSFSHSVTAPPWPHSVRLEAVDPVGNRSVQLVSVVGLFDYRTLPWLPIIVVLTLVVGAILFLRAPRRDAGLAGYDRIEAGALEEIDADVEQPPG
jgi:hypothetical protein